jgi:hypothetical protein
MAQYRITTKGVQILGLPETTVITSGWLTPNPRFWQLVEDVTEDEKRELDAERLAEYREIAEYDRNDNF